MLIKAKHTRKFWSRIEKTDTCWLWHGVCNPNGYAHFKYGPRGRQKMILVHRFAYELLVGEIPEGLTIDHLCRNKTCVNPAHLEPVTGRENTQRWNALRTHCKYGHEFTTENTYIRPLGRECKQCWKRRRRKFALQQRSKKSKSFHAEEVRQ